jgi:arylformamidase
MLNDNLKEKSMQKTQLDTLINSSKLFDITPLINSDLAVFPGDVEFSRNESMSCQKGDHITLSSINSTLHLGAHTDAPNHYHKDGIGIDQRNLKIYMGTCQIIEVSKKPGERIYPEDLNTPIEAQRVLFKTNSYPDPKLFNKDFNSCSGELIQFLANQGVKLIGIDTPSIDPSEDKTLESHLCVYQSDLSILEGVILNDVDPGIYTMICLPLNIEGADASPVRCILLR